eukprot:5102707-Pyramimonas_sp.AAC.1
MADRGGIRLIRLAIRHSPQSFALDPGPRLRLGSRISGRITSVEIEMRAITRLSTEGTPVIGGKLRGQ